MGLRLERVRVRRGGREVLLVDDLAIAEGRVTVVLGPNGAGKTTLVRVLAGVEGFQGRLRFEGALAGEGKRPPVAVAFQRPVFLRGSVRENLDLALRLRRLSREERAERVAAVARDFAILHLLDRPVRRLSAGEAQRANLARALALRAPLTLLDEPLAGVDTATRRDLLALLVRNLRPARGVVVVVTHDPAEAAVLADDLVVLLAGRVHAAGEAAAILAAPPDPETAAFLGWQTFPGEGGTWAVAPGALRLEGGDLRFELVVERAIVLGGERALWGRIGESPCVVRLGEAPLPAPGSRVRVGAPRAMVRWYPADPGRLPR